MDSFSKIIALIIVIVGMLIFPTYYAAQKADAVTQDYVSARTDKFVTDVRKQGKITQEMYNNFMRELDSTGLMYNVSMSCSHSMTVPVFDVDPVTGKNVVKGTTAYDDIIYEDEILKEIYNTVVSPDDLAKGIDSQGSFEMVKGDYFYCEVVNREKTTFTKLSKILLGRTLGGSQIKAFEGGIIRDENY